MTDGNDLPNAWMRMQIGEFPSTQRNKLVILSDNAQRLVVYDWKYFKLIMSEKAIA